MSTKFFNIAAVLTGCKKAPTYEQRKASLHEAISASREFESLSLLSIFLVSAKHIFAVAQMPNEPPILLSIGINCRKAAFQEETYFLTYDAKIGEEPRDYAYLPAIPDDCIAMAQTLGIKLSAGIITQNARIQERAAIAKGLPKGTLLVPTKPVFALDTWIHFAVTQDRSSGKLIYINVEKNRAFLSSKHLITTDYRVVNTDDLPRMLPRGDLVCQEGFLFKMLDGKAEVVGLAISEDEYELAILANPPANPFSSLAWLM